MLYGIMKASLMASPKWWRQKSSKVRGAGLSAAKWARTKSVTQAYATSGGRPYVFAWNG